MVNSRQKYFLPSKLPLSSVHYQPSSLPVLSTHLSDPVWIISGAVPLWRHNDMMIRAARNMVSLKTAPCNWIANTFRFRLWIIRFWSSAAWSDRENFSRKQSSSGGFYFDLDFCFDSSLSNFQRWRARPSGSWSSVGPKLIHVGINPVLYKAPSGNRSVFDLALQNAVSCNHPTMPQSHWDWKNCWSKSGAGQSCLHLERVSSS